MNLLPTMELLQSHVDDLYRDAARVRAGREVPAAPRWPLRRRGRHTR
jgi:hypothetical protein